MFRRARFASAGCGIIIAASSLLHACSGADMNPLLDSETDGNAGSGSNDSGSDRGGPGSNDSGSSSDSGSSDSGSSDSGSSDGSSADCAQLLRNVDDARPAAIVCKFGTRNECLKQVDDVCCPATVSDTTPAKPVRDFETAVQAFKDAQCVAECPPVACNAPAGNCLTGSCAQ